MSRSTQNLSSSSNIDTPLITSNEEFNNTPRCETVSSFQQFPPKMGIKALNHSSINKVCSMKMILS